MSKSVVSKISAYTGISLVVASMIGTGAFTSLGFQLENLDNTAVVLSLWVLGGVLALCGAFSYAEVGTNIKKSGGEYIFLSEIYHPIIGYLSGWISLTVGFAAPVALSVIAFIEYFPYTIPYPKIVGIALIASISMMHSFNLKSSSYFQNISTIFKVLLIILIITIGLVVPSETAKSINFEQTYFQEITSAAFAVSLIYVGYSYSGWNAAAYITEEFLNPRRSLPIALIGGTLLVTVLYTVLQYVILKHVPVEMLVGKLEVGAIAIEYMLGDRFAKIFGMAISLILISGMSAMVWVGPRVTSSIAERFYLWKSFLKKRNGIPVRALWLQFVLSSLLIITGTFEEIMIYCGVLLTISTLLVVMGTFILRYRGRNVGYKSPLFPMPQILFIVVSLWIVVFAFVNNTLEVLVGLSNLGVGLATYFISKRMGRQKGKY